MKKREQTRRPKKKSCQNPRASTATRARAAKRRRTIVCVCGCGLSLRSKWSQRSTRNRPKYIRGHWLVKKETAAAKFVRVNQGKRTCECGCGGVIQTKPHHRYTGIPRFLPHHASRVFHPMRGRCGSANPHFKGGRRRDGRGYILVYLGSEDGITRYELEHRLVMERALGRKLRKGETVHHKNGQRDDNRPCNLELWRSKHPGGQRVEDMLSFAVSIIRDHAGDPGVWPERETESLRLMTETLKNHEVPSKSQLPPRASE